MTDATLSRRSALALTAAAAMFGGASALAAPAGNAAAASWVQLRSFTLKPDANRADMIATLAPKLLPIARQIDGFIAWYVLEPDPATWLAVTFWRDREAAESAHDEIVSINEEYFLPFVEAYPETISAAINIAEVFVSGAATPIP